MQATEKIRNYCGIKRWYKPRAALRQLFAYFCLMILGQANVHAEYALNMMEGVTRISHEVYELHMLILKICVITGIIVFAIMFYSIYHHRKSVGHKAVQFHENIKVEILWTIIPTIILIAMAIPATKTLIDMDDVTEPDLTIKITGWQWKWEYEYLDSGIHFFSSLDAQSNKARQLDSGIAPSTVQNYLLNVDNPLVIPINKKVRFLLTAADVLHAWWVPEFGWKKDNVPGFINDAWTLVEKPGIYRGQCAELCGKDHGYMPIVVIAMEPDKYQQWVAQQLAEVAAQASATDRQWSSDELITRGETVYQSNCSSCHMVDGAGLPGTFPAISGSPIVNGEMAGEVSLVLQGKGMMPAFGKMLNAIDLAAVITYTRNSLGNHFGDAIQPSELVPLLAAMPEQDDDDDE